MLIVTLPLHARVDANGERRRSSSGRPLPGKNDAVRPGLRFKQRVMDACHCGKRRGDAGWLVFFLQKRADNEEHGEAAPRAAHASATGQATAVRGQGGVLRAPASVESSGDSDGHGGDSCSGLSASRDSGGSADVGSIAGQPVDVVPSKCKTSARARIIAAMPSQVPPRWNLRKVLPDAAVLAAGGQRTTDVEAAPMSLTERDAELRKQVTVVRLLLQRARSYAYFS